jgi:DNA-directed RNA polymerase specialized sigma24 family protein
LQEVLLNQEILERLASADWDDIVPRLTLYANYKIDRIRWKKGVIPKGLTAKDMVLGAIVSIYEEKRNWNPTKEPDLLNYLKSIICSNVSHLYKLKEYKTTDPYKETEDGKVVEELQNNADPSSDHAFLLKQQPFTPEEILLDREKTDTFLEAIKGDDELEEVALCLMEGFSKPREIAEYMDKDIAYVYNLRKRFERKCKEFRIATGPSQVKI